MKSVDSLDGEEYGIHACLLVANWLQSRGRIADAERVYKLALRQADALVYYNIDFSATSYLQSRDRMTTKDRLQNDVYWVFAKRGIERDIYKAVTKKKDYTLNHFKRDLLNLF